MSTDMDRLKALECIAAEYSFRMPVLDETPEAFACALADHIDVDPLRVARAVEVRYGLAWRL